jgi:simple sugar transport system ATP-binding protein
VTREEVLSMMAGGQEMDQLSTELEEFARTDADKAEGKTSSLEAAAVAEEALAKSLDNENHKLH